jgi:hypothetical protein
MRTAKEFIIDQLHLLNNWVTGYKKILEGTFEYDNSMPDSCVDAMYRIKIDNVMTTIRYLETIKHDNPITSDEYCKYLEIVNR